jgi:membrane protease YdiL (CAAX protease family)
MATILAPDSSRAGAGVLPMWWRLSLLGLIGTATMLLAPLERIVPTDMPAMTLRLLAVVQPSILVLAFAALGLWAGPKLGLDAPAIRAWAERQPVLPALRPQLLPALIAGAAIALVLVLFWLVVAAMPAVAAKVAVLEMPLVTKLLYGGIVEELLLRWGLMSFFAWAAWHIAGRPAGPPAWCIWTAILFAAVLFAAGHLPMLFLLVPQPPSGLILLVLAGNALPGIVFGWLFWHRGLEAAMIAHALAHLFSVMALALI